MRTNSCHVVGYVAALAAVLMLGAEAKCEIIANSVDDWSATGDQGVKGWTYGYFNSTLDGDPFDPDGYGYTTELFIPFDDEPDDWTFTGTAWDSTLGNVPWTTINQNGGHPNGDNNVDVHFAVRRWESDFDGTAYLTSNLAKQNLNCGNGTAVHLYHNGSMIDEIRVPSAQSDFSTSTVEATLATGDIIDFALSSLGPDDSFADPCDGSLFHLEVSDEKPLEPPAPPEFVASSRDDWSVDGEQGANGWTYGYFNVSLDGDPLDEDGYGYTPDLFVDFEDEPDDWNWTGSQWDSTLGNVPWTEIGQGTGHPNGDNNGDIHFAIRRWESDTSGEVQITSSLAKTNIGGGNGTSVHVYKNGELLDTITVDFDQNTADTSTIDAVLAQGDVIDFALSPLGVDDTFNDGWDGSAWYLEITQIGGGTTVLQAGDADQDLDFDQLDLVRVQVAAKYLTGQPATWGDGDWDGAPGGEVGSPPAGNGLFDQTDIVKALAAGTYLTGPYAAINKEGTLGDGQTSLVYDTGTGELSVDAPAGKELTSINITSGGAKFIGNKPAALDGAFDNFAADNVFKATFGGSFGSISFGNVLPVGLGEDEVAADLSAVGSLAGGGDLGEVDLVYVPEPSSVFLLLAGLSMFSALVAWRTRRDIR